ncbi:hypothetical protein [Alishewanella tabrizica]|uniref:Uncharacterized protein n=1 Tax=Alishewanella tabrizica TaxID=671278 RepID=A0ABQ2WMD8_9ALTE|nr:hypothetical protein [Alishewanella tabrizica]GGW64004.1 hypothetical protein GCM10008111_19830 [Alishewanella tabrizica]
MRLSFVALFLFLSMPILAEDTPNSILDSLLGKCINESSRACESVLVGDIEKKQVILSILNVMRSSIVFEKLFIETYGKQKYAELIDTYSLTITPIKSSDYYLQATSENRATFQGPDNTVLSILNTGKGWVIDLENTSFSGVGEPSNSAMLEFFKLIERTHSHLIHLIKHNSPENDVFKKGGLFYLASIYSLVTEHQKREFDSIFKKYDADIDSLKKEILTDVNN